MAFTPHRLLGIGVGLALVIALVVGVYAFRDRLRPQGADHSAMGQSPALPTHGDDGGHAGSAGAVTRGDVTIDPQRQQLIGVRLAPVMREPMAAVVRTTGGVRYDETRQADVNVKLDGWIRELFVDYTGQFIQKGQPLFTLYSPDLLTAQNEYLLALKTRDQLQQSAIADAREYAGRVVDAARQRLALWDLPAEEIAAIEQSRQARDAITFRSPASGYVLEKTVVKGMHVTPGQTLYKVADLSAVWVVADVYEQVMAAMRVGQQATVTLDAYPG